MRRQSSLLVLVWTCVAPGCGLFIEPSYPLEAPDVSRADLTPPLDREPPVDAAHQDLFAEVTDDTARDAEVFDAAEVSLDVDVFDAFDAFDAAEVSPDADVFDAFDAAEIATDTAPEAASDAPSACGRRPRLVAPLSGAITLSTGPVLEWSDNGCSGDFLLTVARDRALSTPVAGLERRAVTGLTFTLDGLAPGVYFWRVSRAVMLTTAVSPVSEFRVLPSATDAVGARRAIVGIMPDINGDGRSDLVLGLTSAMGAGTVQWLTSEGPGSRDMSGTISATSLMLDSSLRPSFGARVSALGDVNDDGFPDVLVATRGGQAVVLRGDPAGLSDARADVIATLAPLLSQDGNFPSVVGVGDLNRDGFGDIAVGAGSSMSSRIQLISLNPSRAFSELHGLSEDVTFGRSIAPVGDANGDGTSDFVVGAPAERGTPMVTGQRYLVTGSADRGRPVEANLVPLRAPSPSVAGPNWVSGAGDLNNDGLGDWIWSQNQQAVFESASMGFTSLGAYSGPPPSGVLIAASVGVVGRRVAALAFTLNATGGSVQTLSLTGIPAMPVASTPAILMGDDVRQVGTLGDIDVDELDDSFVLTMDSSGFPRVRAYSFVTSALTVIRTFTSPISGLRPHVATAY